jgi:hypothetical protein
MGLSKTTLMRLPCKDCRSRHFHVPSFSAQPPAADFDLKRRFLTLTRCFLVLNGIQLFQFFVKIKTCPDFFKIVQGVENQFFN